MSRPAVKRYLGLPPIVDTIHTPKATPMETIRWARDAWNDRTQKVRDAHAQYNKERAGGKPPATDLMADETIQEASGREKTTDLFEQTPATKAAGADTAMTSVPPRQSASATPRQGPKPNHARAPKPVNRQRPKASQ